jgi:hypothetical protein
VRIQGWPPREATPGSNTVPSVTEPSADTRPPRGALIVIAVGLLACVVAAVAATGKGEGEAAQLEWVQKREIADGAPVPVPGGGGTMRLTDVKIQATGSNVSGYSLYRVLATLGVTADSPVGGGQILCTVDAPPDTEIAQNSEGLRATYPRSADEGGIYKQGVPEGVLLRFSSKSSELTFLELTDLPERFTTERGVKVQWPEYTVGKERIKYILPAGKPKVALELPFFTVWRTTAVPSAAIGCALTTSAGTARVAAEIALAERSPPIDEEAEALRAEEREEREEREEEKEGDGG